MILFFGDDDYDFDLSKIKNIVALEAACGPIFEIYGRLFRGTASINDVVETIRLAAIGGGMSPVSAKVLVEQYVEGCPLASPDDKASPLATAQVIIEARILGLAKIEPGKGEGSKKKSETLTDGST